MTSVQLFRGSERSNQELLARVHAYHNIYVMGKLHE